MHTDQLSTTILVNLSDNTSRTNSFGSWGTDFSFIWKYWINCVEYIANTCWNRFLNVSFEVYLVSVSSANVISLQRSHVNNLPATFADDFPHCGKHFMDDAIFIEVGGNCTQQEISSFRLDFDFTMLSLDSLIDNGGVVVFDNIPLGHCLTFACCTK